jgi:histidyl-tRNA synthetase
MGIERVLDLVAQLGLGPLGPETDVYAVIPADAVASTALALVEALRRLGLAVVMHAATGEGWGSMKSQMRRADASGARFALIFGEDEVARGCVSLKPLRDAQSPQRELPIEDVASWAPGLRSA